MALEITAKLEKLLPVQSGTSARGNWSKQDFIVQTQETYPRTICINVWGEEKVNELSKFSLGSVLKISLNLESREYNGKWYSDIRAWKIEAVTSNNASQDISSEVYAGADNEEDDMPF